MMENDTNEAHIRHLIRPSVLEALVATLSFFVIVLLAIHNTTLKTIYGYDLVIETIEATYSNVSIHFEEGILGYLTTVLTWGAFGSVVYIVLWIIFVFVRDARNDIVAGSAFKHPNSFHQSDFWLAAVTRKTAQFASIACACVLIYAVFRLIGHIFSIYEFPKQSNSSPLMSIISAGILWLITVHTLVVIFRAWTSDSSD